jgi:hypothetical protein
LFGQVVTIDEVLRKIRASAPQAQEPAPDQALS